YRHTRPNCWPICLEICPSVRPQASESSRRLLALMSLPAGHRRPGEAGHVCLMRTNLRPRVPDRTARPKSLSRPTQRADHSITHCAWTLCFVLKNDRLQDASGERRSRLARVDVGPPQRCMMATAWQLSLAGQLPVSSPRASHGRRLRHSGSLCRIRDLRLLPAAAACPTLPSAAPREFSASLAGLAAPSAPDAAWPAPPLRRASTGAGCRSNSRLRQARDALPSRLCLRGLGRRRQPVPSRLGAATCYCRSCTQPGCRSLTADSVPHWPALSSYERACRPGVQLRNPRADTLDRSIARAWSMFAAKRSCISYARFGLEEAGRLLRLLCRGRARREFHRRKEKHWRKDAIKALKFVQVAKQRAGVCPAPAAIIIMAMMAETGIWTSLAANILKSPCRHLWSTCCVNFGGRTEARSADWCTLHRAAKYTGAYWKKFDPLAELTYRSSLNEASLRRIRETAAAASGNHATPTSIATTGDVHDDLEPVDNGDDIASSSATPLPPPSKRRRRLRKSDAASRSGGGGFALCRVAWPPCPARPRLVTEELQGCFVLGSPKSGKNTLVRAVAALYSSAPMRDCTLDWCRWQNAEAAAAMWQAVLRPKPLAPSPGWLICCHTVDRTDPPSPSSNKASGSPAASSASTVCPKSSSALTDIDDGLFCAPSAKLSPRLVGSAANAPPVPVRLFAFGRVRMLRLCSPASDSVGGGGMPHVSLDCLTAVAAALTAKHTATSGSPKLDARLLAIL
uniref:Myb-like domain-containing protein n=1 Tax=Macrostomum lignano TaxID=282301 RepID=A0A1I8FE80_9PLAT